MKPLPIAVKRGSSFAYTFTIPDNFLDGHFANFTIRSQMRRQDNDMPSGFIAELACAWVNGTTTRQLKVSTPLTKFWPVGLAELDYLLIAPDGSMYRGDKVLFDIQSGVTQ